MQYQQARVYDCFIRYRNARNVVDGFVYTGVGVEVLTESYAFCCKPVNQLVAGEVDCSVETHVLEEVSQATLLFGFENRADILCNKEVGLSFRGLVVTNVVRQSVVETSYT